MRRTHLTGYGPAAKDLYRQLAEVDRGQWPAALAALPDDDLTTVIHIAGALCDSEVGQLARAEQLHRRVAAHRDRAASALSSALEAGRSRWAMWMEEAREAELRAVMELAPRRGATELAGLAEQEWKRRRSPGGGDRIRVGQVEL